MGDSKDKAHEILGRAEEVIGYATGDRTVEAKGRAKAEEESDDVELDVRKEHGEYQPDRLD